MKPTKQQVDSWLRGARKREIISVDGILSDRLSKIPHVVDFLYPSSLQKACGVTHALLRIGRERFLGVFGHARSTEAFCGVLAKTGSREARFCPLTHGNAETIRAVLPFTAPTVLSDQHVTFGVGDRLGIAGPGHVRLFKKYKAAPVFAQQSVREVGLTQRTYEDVLDSSTWAVFQEGFTDPWGADGDHLKTKDWVRKVLDIGFTMITADVSDFIRQEFSGKTTSEILSAYMNLDSSYRDRIEKEYLDRCVELETGRSVQFSRGSLAEVALIYGKAIAHAAELYRAGVEAQGEGAFDFELSIDETDTPTTPQAHVFVAKETQRSGVKITSLAPRFVGDFQKGIDYIGDAKEFERSFETHAEIARKLGYRTSMHSGSDKFSVFFIIGQRSSGKFHIKTSGTNWLVALRVISEQGPDLFRELYDHAQKTFEEAKRHYHVTARLENTPVLSTHPNSYLPHLFQNPDVRQVLHITYGEIFTDRSLKARIYDLLHQNIGMYWTRLEEHIGEHLELLGVQNKDA